MTVAILGGTFDPPHWGHLIIAEAAWSQLGVEKVIFIPAGMPWQKPELTTTAAHRYKMTRLAVAGVPYFEVSATEIDREGPSYTIDTVTEFVEREEIWLVLGTDAAAGATSWHRWDELRTVCRAAVAPRAEVDPGEVKKVWEDRLKWLDIDPINISATALRRRLTTGHSVRFSLPEAVLIYIHSNGLYRS